MEKKNATMLKVVEIILWVSALLVLLNLLIVLSTSLDKINWLLVITVELIIFSGIAYIKEWIKNFEIPFGLMILGLLSNISAFSIVDVIIYVSGIYGILLKKKEYGD